MNRIHPATLYRAMQCRPQAGSARALAQLAWEGEDRFSGGKSVSEGCAYTFTGWLNPDQLIGRGRCRVTLTPT